MLDQKKIQSHIANMETYANMALREAEKLKILMQTESVKPVKIDATELNFRKRRKKSLSVN